MQPTISILVPVYQVALFIEQCAHSLFQQTYNNIEYIFVNDASPDNSIELLQQVLLHYPQRKTQVTIIHHTINQGIGATRNTLLKAAKGDYLMWVDSDDFITTNAVELLVDAIAVQHADIVTSECYFEYRGTPSSIVHCSKTPENNLKYIDALAFRQVRAALWGTLSKRSIWIDNNIQMAENLNFAEDYYTTVRLFYFATTLTVVHQPFYFYNQTNQNSYTTGHKKEMHFQSIFTLFNHLNLFFDQQKEHTKFERFLAKAQMMELSALLLHTTSTLRKKYGPVLAGLTQQYPEIKLPLTKWQLFLLQLITNGHFTIADVAFLIAKIMRKFLSIPF